MNHDTEPIQHDADTLVPVLSKMLKSNIIHASAQTIQLQGGTLGDVRLVEGLAKTADDSELPYRVVLKSQKKWERPGDPDSWRREYDLYTSDLRKVFNDSLQWPRCYHAEMNNDEIHLWMEYMDGISGNELDLKHLEVAAEQLGHFQGRLYRQQEMLSTMDFLSEAEVLERNFKQWHTQTFSYEFLISEQCRLPEFLKRMLKNGEIQLYDGKSFEYGYLRSDRCDIPKHLKHMLFDLDENREAVFNSIKSMPVVLCHRDFWVENIFLSEGKVRLIDWDCVGLGYLGEDIASLIYDETTTENLKQYFYRLTSSYKKGIGEYMKIPGEFHQRILDMILILFGYRIVQKHMFTDGRDEKDEQISRLQKLYEIKTQLIQDQSSSSK